jgi:hypothetical protein
VVIAVGSYLYLQKASVAEQILEELTTFQQGQLSLFQQQVGTLLTISLLLIGGACALLLHFHEKNAGSQTEQRLAVLSVAASVLSAYAGYLAYAVVMWMLDLRIFNLANKLLNFLSVSQHLMAATATALLVSSFLCASTSARR